MKRCFAFLCLTLWVGGCTPVAVLQRRATVRIEARRSEETKADLLRLKTLTLLDQFVKRGLQNPQDPWTQRDITEILTGMMKAGIDTNERASRGSGFFVREPKTGQVLAITNKHVVESALTVNVLVGERVGINDCHVRYVDDKVDLAVITIPDTDLLDGIEIAVLSDADAMDNDTVQATGYPAVQNKEQSYRITPGSVSNAAFKLDGAPDEVLIQHTADIDPGNSGGPLFKDRSTEVLGVNTLIVFSNRSLFAAIPARVVKRVTEKAVSLPATGVLGTESHLHHACRQLVQEINVNDRPNDSTMEMMSYVGGMRALGDRLEHEIAISVVRNLMSTSDERCPKKGPRPAYCIKSPPPRPPPGPQGPDTFGTDSRLASLFTSSDRHLVAGGRRQLFENIRADLRAHGGAKEEWCQGHVEEDFKTYERDGRVRISLPVGHLQKHVLFWRFEQGHWRVFGFE